jgi:SAM-dependent methyltransferase
VSIEDRSLGADYFARVYAASPDPWHFETSEYERKKYEATLAALGSRRFRRAFEIGCSIGVLTALLADRCDMLLSVDVNEAALERARVRCADRNNVSLERMQLPREFPSGSFDLVVVSEVGYYWSKADLLACIDKIAAAAKGGTVELVHYLPKVRDYPLRGDDVHDAFLSDSRFTRISGFRAEEYRLDVLTL